MVSPTNSICGTFSDFDMFLGPESDRRGPRLGQRRTVSSASSPQRRELREAQGSELPSVQEGRIYFKCVFQVLPRILEENDNKKFFSYSLRVLFAGTLEEQRQRVVEVVTQLGFVLENPNDVSDMRFFSDSLSVTGAPLNGYDRFFDALSGVSHTSLEGLQFTTSCEEPLQCLRVINPAE